MLDSRRSFLLPTSSKQEVHNIAICPKLYIVSLKRRKEKPFPVANEAVEIRFPWKDPSSTKVQPCRN